MNWDYTKDNRTDEQVKEDYIFGKKHEKKMFNLFNCHKFWINEKDEFGKTSEYAPDCFLFIKGIWYPTELKYTKVELTYVELKKNQADKLKEIKGIYIQGTPTKFAIIKPENMTEEVIGYCNKPCYRITPKWNKLI